jgi:plastocyanin
MHIVRGKVVLGGAAAILAIALGALALSFGSDTARAADETVIIDNFAFSPATVTIQVGDTVTWSNMDDTAHTATADDASWDSGNLAPGATFPHTFTQAGTFTYHCEIHPTMTGTVVVEQAGETPTTTSTATTTATASATATTATATSTPTSTATPTATSTSIPTATATSTTAAATTSATAAATQAPAPPATGTGSAGGTGNAGLFVLAGLGILALGGGAAAAVRRRG